MDVTGARWSLAGAEAIVKLRSLRSSGDFENYWQFHEDQEYIRNHESFYADPSIYPIHLNILFSFVMNTASNIGRDRYY